MTTLTEGDLQISFPSTVRARKFDSALHGLSHCMKAVDFIAELTDRYYFIEFKDPDKVGVPQEEHDKYVESFLAGAIDEEFKYKCRDTFLYEWAAERIAKPIHYLVLVAIEALTEAELLARTEALKRKLPIKGPESGEWKRTFVAGCAVFNIDTWNRHIKTCPVSRVI